MYFAIDPSTVWCRGSEPNHVSNPHSVMKKFKPHLIYRYGQAMALLNNKSTSLGHSIRGSCKWDNLSATNYCEWRNTTDGNGRRHQLWYEDPRSFGTKAAAARALSVRGIGIWLPELVGDAAEAAAMWAVLPGS